MKKTLRKIKRNRLWIAINLLGLSVAFIASVFVISHVVNELSYDKFYKNSDRICRMTCEISYDNHIMHAAKCSNNLNLAEFPQIEGILRLNPSKNSVVKIEENSFSSRNIFYADSTFLDFFDLELISGDRNTLSKPKMSIITKSIAEKYFGTTDCIGETILISPQQWPQGFDYTVGAVVENVPSNSHIKVDVLTSFDDPSYDQIWAYRYFILKEGTSLEDLALAMNKSFAERFPEYAEGNTYHLQALADIHLKSHKERELNPNGDVKSIYILLGALLAILIIAFLNFVNLTRVQFISNLKILNIKRINGASKYSLLNESVIESMVLSFVVIIVSSIVVLYLKKFVSVDISIIILILVSLAFIGLIILFANLPKVIMQKRIGDFNLFSKRLSYSGTLFFQFILAALAVSFSINMILQMNNLYDRHPQSDNVDMIVMKEVHHNVVSNYELFKENLLTKSSIKDVTAAMEAPGGNILDGTPISFDGASDQLHLNLFTADTNFCNFMDIKPLAGSFSNFTKKTTEWEGYAANLSNMVVHNYGSPEDLKKLQDYVGEPAFDKFIINTSALAVLGIENPEDAIGKEIKMHHQLSYLFNGGEIAAVIPDFHYTNLHNPENPMIIAPKSFCNYCILIKAQEGNLTNAISDIEQVWEEINPDYPFEYEFISSTYRKVYLPEITQMRAMIFLSIISIILAGLGIFAMTIFNLQKRIKEIGIRKINGADTRTLIKMMNKEILKWVLAASLVSVPIAYLILRKWLENFAYSISIQWWTFAVAIISCLLFAIILISVICYGAAKRNPVDALRYE